MLTHGSMVTIALRCKTLRLIACGQRENTTTLLLSCRTLCCTRLMPGQRSLPTDPMP